MTTRFFFQKSTKKYIDRIDFNSPTSDKDAKVEVGNALNLKRDIGVVTTKTLNTIQREALAQAIGWGGKPPDIPTVGTGVILKQPTPPLEPEVVRRDELVKKLETKDLTLSEVNDLLRVLQLFP